MPLKADVSSPIFISALKKLDPEIRKPTLKESRVQRFDSCADKSKRNYDPMAHMISDLLKDTIFFAEDSAGDLYGVYIADGNEYIARFDYQDVFTIIGDSICNWAREVYLNNNAYDVEGFERVCEENFSIKYSPPNEDKFPNIYLDYFP